MFVAVGTDKATGRALVAIDAAAVDALSDLLDNHVPYDLATDPGVHGVDQDTADRVSAVRHAILTPLLRLQGYL
jgi:hypothetical protein